MKQRALLNRREFVQFMGCSSALGAAGTLAPWLTGTGYAENRATPLFAYVGYLGQAQGDATARRSKQGIQVFAIHQEPWGERWIPLQSVASEQPASLALHPNQQFLYAVNEIANYQNLPSGAIEAYAIHPRDGYLTLLNRQPLSLSGTMPRHLAISPDGRSAIVAVHGGGAWNVLPISPDGALGRVSGILKEASSGPDRENQETSHPQMLAFDTTGRHLLGTDLGSDRLSVFTLESDKLNLHDRISVQSGNGPRHLAFHPSGHLLYVKNELDSSVSCYGYDAPRGKILDRLQNVSTLSENFHHQKNSSLLSGTLTIHPSGMFLYTSNFCRKSDMSPAGDITTWRIDPTSGTLTPIQCWTEQLHAPRVMTTISGGAALLVSDNRRHSIFRLRIDPHSGRLSQPIQIAHIPAPLSLVVKYL